MSEYLVAHELVHLRERYHSPAFWERLERVLPDYEERREPYHPSLQARSLRKQICSARHLGF